MANKIIQLNDGGDKLFPVAAITEHSLCAFTITVSDGKYYLNYASANNSSPFSVTLVGTDYVLLMEY